MEKAILAITAYLGMLTGPAMAQERAESPAGPPPQFRTVAAYDEKLNSVQLTEERWIRKTKGLEVDHEVDGRIPTLKKAGVTYYWATIDTTMSLEFADAVDVAGKKLSREELAERLTAGTIVLVSSDGQPLTPPYRTALSKDTVILISPRYAYHFISSPPVGRVLIEGTHGQTRP